MALIIQTGVDKDRGYQNNHKWFQDILKSAVENGSISSLQRRLDRLADYSDSTVVIRPGSWGSAATVLWYRGTVTETDPYMVGGLSFCSSDNSWSVNT